MLNRKTENRKNEIKNRKNMTRNKNEIMNTKIKIKKKTNIIVNINNNKICGNRT